MCSAERFVASILARDNRGLQAQPLSAPQTIEAALQEIARVGGERGHIGHDAQRDQIEIIVGAFGFSGQMQHLLGEFERHADTGQRSQRMIGRQALGIDQRVGVGQLVGQIVMIGDEDSEAARLGVSDRLVFGDAGIAREQDVDVLIDQALQRFELDAVRFGETLWNVEGRVGLEIAQQRDEQRGRGLPVGVEVAPYGDFLAARDGAIQPVGGEGQIGQVGRGGRACSDRDREKPLRLAGVVRPRRASRLRHDRMAADRRR